MMMAVAVLAVAIMALMTTIATAQRSNLLCEEERVALDAAMSKMEEIREQNFDSIATIYSAGSGAWDFYDPRTGAETSYGGNWFAVVRATVGGRPLYEIDPPRSPGAYTRLPHGQVIVVTDPDADETDAIYAAPFPVDLDGDGDRDSIVDFGDLGDDLGAGSSKGKVVLVIVRWESAAAGTRKETVLRTVLAKR